MWGWWLLIASRMRKSIFMNPFRNALGDYGSASVLKRGQLSMEAKLGCTPSKRYCTLTLVERKFTLLFRLFKNILDSSLAVSFTLCKKLNKYMSDIIVSGNFLGLLKKFLYFSNQTFFLGKQPERKSDYKNHLTLRKSLKPQWFPMCQFQI